MCATKSENLDSTTHTRGHRQGEKHIYLYIFWLGLGSSLYLLGFAVEVYRTSALGFNDEFGDAHSLDVCAALVGIFGLALGGSAVLVVAPLAFPLPCGSTACGRGLFRTSAQERAVPFWKIARFVTSAGL